MKSLRDQTPLEIESSSSVSNYATRTLGGDARSPRKEVDERKFPMTAAKTIQQYREHLNNYEQGEILDYPTVYYVNTREPADNSFLKGGVRNAGYDDDRGDYRYSLNDHIMYRYEVVSRLGKGSFGQVVKAFDHKEKELVALKIIRNKKRFHKQAVVEVRILEHMKRYDKDDNKNVIKIKEYFLFRKHLVSRALVLPCSALRLSSSASTFTSSLRTTTFRAFPRT